jgi:hypothetical protein
VHYTVFSLQNHYGLIAIRRTNTISLLYLHVIHFVRRTDDGIVFPRRHCALLHAWNSGRQSSIKRPTKPIQVSFITTSESILIKSRNRCPRSLFHGQSQPITSVCREQGLYWISSIFVRSRDTNTAMASHRHFHVWFRFATSKYNV